MLPRRLAVFLAAGLALSAAPAHAVTYPSGFEERVLVSGLTGATGVAFAPNGRTYVIEKAGVLKVAQPGASTATTLLDLRSRVNSDHDRGLLGIALDSSFATNGYIYLLYTYELNPLVADSDAPMVSRLTRVQVTSTGALVNPANPETVLLGSYNSGPCPTPSNTVDCIPSDGLSHSIGSVRAAPDGTLWVGSGDAADFNRVDTMALRTYDEQSFAGKILHIDRDGRGLPGHPFCPGNANLDQVCTKLHSKGFRNPFRFSVRPGGGVAVGDVGWNTTEELDLIGPTGGRSYGWPCYEGSARTPGYRDNFDCSTQYAKEGEPDANVPPDYEYNHPVGNAIIGGPTYAGDQYPDGYRDTIFVGDYVGNFVKRVVLDAQGRVTGVQPFATDWIGTDLVAAPNGDLVYAYFGTGAPGDGGIYRIVYTPGNGSPVARMSASQTTGSAPLPVSFDGRASSDPNGDALTYTWDFGDGSPTTGGPTAQHTYTQGGVFTARLTVSDGRGLTNSTTTTISTTGNGPTPTIASPADNSNYQDGDTVALQGSAADEQDGNIPASGLDWLVRLHHGQHIHPVSSFDGVAQASFTALRDHDADSFYEITLTATDSNGLTGSRTITVRPQTVNLTLASTPAGAPLSYAGVSGSAPFTRAAAIGFDTTITATTGFTSGGKTYVFDHWSDGGARSHDIRVGTTDATLRAFYLEELARGRPASSSGVEAAGFEAGKAVDGDAATRWSSPYANGHWWQVDLGATKEISRVELDWEFARASSYRILTSTDGTTFTQAATETTTAPGTKATSFAARQARYVRVEITQRATQWGASFWEARVFGTDPGGGGDTTPPDTSIVSGPTGTVTSTSASFGFSSTEAGSTFECRLDNGAWVAGCISPKDYSGLVDGGHSFDVRATDAAGNTDPTAASRSWTVAAPQSLVELARGRPASASGVEAAAFGAANAVDGNSGTRWASPYANGHWWQVDLGAARQVSRVELDWEFAYASSYRILTSTDGTSFTQAATETTTAPGTKITGFAARQARYVRVEITQRATQWGASFWEARVFGTAGAAATARARTGGSAPSAPRRAAPLVANPTPTRPKRVPKARRPRKPARFPATPGLAHWWRLGDRGASARDSKGANAGSYRGDPAVARTMIAGDENGARQFDGVDDRVVMSPSPFGSPASFSVETWVRIDAAKPLGQYHFLLTDAANDLVSDGFSLVVDSSNRPMLFVARSAARRAAAISRLALVTGTTHHVVGTYDGARLRVYVDGAKRGSVPYAAGVAWAASRKLLLGSQAGSMSRGQRYLNGRLDEVALYRVALSAATVRAHNAAGR